MRIGIFHVSVVIAVGCSSPGQPVTDAGADADAASTYSCPSNLEGFPYDAARSCFEPAAHVSGICMSVPTPSSKGLEAICAVDGSGQLYVLTVPTDASLSGSGWTFGPRSFPSLVHDSAALSTADATTCAEAESKLSGLTPRTDAMCSVDGGTE